MGVKNEIDCNAAPDSITLSHACRGERLVRRGINVAVGDHQMVRHLMRSATLAFNHGVSYTRVNYFINLKYKVLY